MAYYKDYGYKSGRDFYHNKFPISKSWYSTTNSNNLPYINESIRCCKNRCNKSFYSHKCCCRNTKSPPSCGCRTCNCCGCCKGDKTESHKFIDYADASISSSNLTEEIPDQKQQTVPIVVCTKANVSVQSSETYCDCHKFSACPTVSPGCLKVEPNLEHLNNGLYMNNSFPINQQVPILSTCIKRTEICNSVCPAARCFNFEKQIELNPCDKNVNINVEVKVKKKKKNVENDYRKKCKCKGQDEELLILKPCVCIKEPCEKEDIIKKCKCERPKSCLIHCPNMKQEESKCTCEKPKPLTFCVSPNQEPSKTFSCDVSEPVTICCPPCQSPDKSSKIFNILSNFCKSKDSKPEDINRQKTNENNNVFVCKPISPNDLTSMLKGLKSCLPNCSHNRKHSISPSECVKMFKKKLDKQKTEKSKTSKNHVDSINSDITLEMLKKKPSSKYSCHHSQRKFSSSR